MMNQVIEFNFLVKNNQKSWEKYFLFFKGSKDILFGEEFRGGREWKEKS